MVVLCDDNEMYDNTPRPESHPSLPFEATYDYSKLIDQQSDLMFLITDTTERLKKVFKVTNALYEWHVAQNHFPDTRGQHRYGGLITLIPAPHDEIPAASPTVKGCHTSVVMNAFNRMGYHSREMCNWIWDLYLYPNDFLDTRYNWDAARAILLATWPSPSNKFPVATLNSISSTSVDSNTNGPVLKIQSESNEHFALLESPTRTLYATMPEPTRTQVRVENQPKARRSYLDFLNALFVLNTRFTALYEHYKLEHKMNKEMYEWHLSQNHFTEKCSVILSKL